MFAAVDLGASAGRVVAGIVDHDGAVALEEIHRFPHAAHRAQGSLRWDIRALFADVLEGLTRLAGAYPQIESIGIDTWGVDYGLLDRDGELLDDPVSHRDDRTAAFVDTVHERVPPDELFDRTGVQFLPFNTIYQLVAEQQGRAWSRASHVVMLPDLLAYWLTGELATEVTNASTTGLLDVHTGTWSIDVLDRLGITPSLLPPLERPGTIRGTVRSSVREAIGMGPSTVVTTVASHDTASAVVAVPASGERFAFVSSGTWSIVGLELDQPVLTNAVRDANFSNERGVDDRTRFLRNVGGLWLLQECIRAWAEHGQTQDLDALLDDAAALRTGGPTIDVDDPTFIAPDEMPERIAGAVAGHEPPSTPAAITRCILDSLAVAYARTSERAELLASRNVDVVHIVGGGSQNALLCQLTADACGTPVTAGPAEATSLGNVLVQARAHGAAPPTLEQLRATVARRPDIRWFEPRRTIGAFS